jgi:hypothetical protein
MEVLSYPGQPLELAIFYSVSATKTSFMTWLPQCLTNIAAVVFQSPESGKKSTCNEKVVIEDILIKPNKSSL